ncbi:MAG: hypothetical protein SGCHY_003645 [Lobulomycetales sp.]
MTIDRKTQTPFLVRVKHPQSKEGALLYTWLDATLREVVSLLAKSIPELKEPQAEADLRSAAGTVLGRVFNWKESEADSKTLADLNFVPGDQLDLSIANSPKGPSAGPIRQKPTRSSFDSFGSGSRRAPYDQLVVVNLAMAVHRAHMTDAFLATTMVVEGGIGMTIQIMEEKIEDLPVTETIVMLILEALKDPTTATVVPILEVLKGLTTETTVKLILEVPKGLTTETTVNLILEVLEGLTTETTVKLILEVPKGLTTETTVKLILEMLKDLRIGATETRPSPEVKDLMTITPPIPAETIDEIKIRIADTRMIETVEEIPKTTLGEYSSRPTIDEKERNREEKEISRKDSTNDMSAFGARERRRAEAMDDSRGDSKDTSRGDSKDTSRGDSKETPTGTSDEKEQNRVASDSKEASDPKEPKQENIQGTSAKDFYYKS